MAFNQEAILHRVGTVVLAVGVIDIGVMVVCITSGVAYSSSLNVFAVVAGVFLRRGSLPAASRIRWIAAFMCTVLAALIPASPFLQPIDLTLTKARLAPFGFLSGLAIMACTLAVLAWVTRQLGHPDVLAALRASGRKVRDLRIPAVAGLAATALTVGVMQAFLGGETAMRAKAQVAQELGPGYRLHVNAMHISRSSHRTVVSGVVTAWNENEVRLVPVGWEEVQGKP